MKTRRRHLWTALRGALARPRLPRRAGGCAMPEPWVKPYERERLADPLMKLQRDALSAKHLRARARGARRRARRHRRAGRRLWLQLNACRRARVRSAQRALLALGERRDGARALPFVATARLLGALGGLLATGHAHAAELPEDRADLMLHSFDGGGVTACGPALLVRKSLLNKVSLSGDLLRRHRQQRLDRRRHHRQPVPTKRATSTALAPTTRCATR